MRRRALIAAGIGLFVLTDVVESGERVPDDVS